MTLDTAKLIAGAVVALGLTGWGASCYSDWRADLRFEGERRILMAQRDTADQRAQALTDSLTRVDSLRAAEVERARQEAEADRARARQAEQAAAEARRRGQAVSDSVVELYGDTVRAAVEAVQVEHRRESAALRVTVSELRLAEARAWAAVDTMQARLKDVGTLLIVERARVAQRDAIIERWERSSGGHGLVTDVLIGLGGLAVGFAGASLAGG